MAKGALALRGGECITGDLLVAELCKSDRDLFGDEHTPLPRPLDTFNLFGDFFEELRRYILKKTKFN